jgi:hypothetical protein
MSAAAPPEGMPFADAGQAAGAAAEMAGVLSETIAMA